MRSQLAGECGDGAGRGDGGRHHAAAVERAARDHALLPAEDGAGHRVCDQGLGAGAADHHVRAVHPRGVAVQRPSAGGAADDRVVLCRHRPVRVAGPSGDRQRGRQCTGQESRSNKPAAHDVWTIGTTLALRHRRGARRLRARVRVAAWVAGVTPVPRRCAASRARADAARSVPRSSTSSQSSALLLVVLWGPTPATRQIAYIIGFAVCWLSVSGACVARRPGIPRRASRGHDESIRALFRERGRPGATASPIAGGANGGRVHELERLAMLHDRGSLTDAEFASEKAALIDGS